AGGAGGARGRTGPTGKEGVGEVRRFERRGEQVQAVGFSGNGKRVLTWSGRTLRLWDIESGKEAKSLEADNVLKVVVSPDGRFAALARTDGRIRLWNVKDWKESVLLRAHQPEANRPAVSAMAFRADGQ